MELAALQENNICDRFSSTTEQAKWLSTILGWDIDDTTLRRAVYRFNCRNNSKEDPEKYIIWKRIYKEEHEKYVEIKRKLMEDLIFRSN